MRASAFPPPPLWSRGRERGKKEKNGERVRFLFNPPRFFFSGRVSSFKAGASEEAVTRNSLFLNGPPVFFEKKKVPTKNVFRRLRAHRKFQNKLKIVVSPRERKTPSLPGPLFFFVPQKMNSRSRSRDTPAGPNERDVLIVLEICTETAEKIGRNR